MVEPESSAGESKVAGLTIGTEYDSLNLEQKTKLRSSKSCVVSKAILNGVEQPPTLEAIECGDTPRGSCISWAEPNGDTGAALHRHTMAAAWEALKQSIVYFRGQPIGTVAAIDKSQTELNYDQVFMRDFVPSALALLMNGEPLIVKNFLLETARLQSREKMVDLFKLGQGVMPASFKVHHSHPIQKTETLLADFGEIAIGRVAPVDSGLWWIFLLHAYTKYTLDNSLAESPHCQRAMRLILKLWLSEGFDTSPALLCADGCSMIDRRMGIYGHPIEIQSLFFMARRCASSLLKDSDGDFRYQISKRIKALSYHLQSYYWLDFQRLNDIYRYLFQLSEVLLFCNLSARKMVEPEFSDCESTGTGLTIGTEHDSLNLEQKTKLRSTKSCVVSKAIVNGVEQPPTLEAIECGDTPRGSCISWAEPNGDTGAALHRHTMAAAWEALKQSIVYFRGQPIGTVAAIDKSQTELNYDQVFMRDFVPSALAFLMNGEPLIVKNFLLETARLQSREKMVNLFKLGQGVMPASFKVHHSHPTQKTETLLADFGEIAIGRVAPVDSGLWWIFLLHAYTKYTLDNSLTESPHQIYTGSEAVLMRGPDAPMPEATRAATAEGQERAVIGMMDLSSLDLEILRIIAGHLATSIHSVVSMRSVCQHWRNSVPPVRGPWLVLSSDDSNRPTVFLGIVGGALVRQYPQFPPPREDYCYGCFRGLMAVCAPQAAGGHGLAYSLCVNCGRQDPIAAPLVDLTNVCDTPHLLCAASPGDPGLIWWSPLVGGLWHTFNYDLGNIPRSIDWYQGTAYIAAAPSSLIVDDVFEDRVMPIPDEIEEVLYDAEVPVPEPDHPPPRVIHFDLHLEPTLDTWGVRGHHAFGLGPDSLICILLRDSEDDHIEARLCVLNDDGDNSTLEETDNIGNNALFLGENQAFTLPAAGGSGLLPNTAYVADDDGQFRAPRVIAIDLSTGDQTVLAYPPEIGQLADYKPPSWLAPLPHAWHCNSPNDQ